MHVVEGVNGNTLHQADFTFYSQKDGKPVYPDFTLVFIKFKYIKKGAINNNNLKKP